MNISTLLQSELDSIVRNRMNRKYDPPTFQWDERVKMLPGSEAEALKLYKSLAYYEELRSLKIEVDNAIQALREYHAEHRKSRKLSLFWKYYIPLKNPRFKYVEKDRITGERVVKSRAIHTECKDVDDTARLAYLYAMQEIDQQFTLGTGFRPDASFVKEFETRNAKAIPFGRRVSARSRVERYVEQQLERDAHEDYEVRDGILVSQYAILMGLDS